MSSLLRGSRKVLLGLGLASCGAAVLALMGISEDHPIAKASSFYDHYIHNHRLFYEPQGILSFSTILYDKR